MSLWLYATLEGVGSARLLDRLCQSDAAYLWLLGGVTVNYHTLRTFGPGRGRCWTSFCRARWRTDRDGCGAGRDAGGRRHEASGGSESGTFRRSERLAMLERRLWRWCGGCGRSRRGPAAAQRRTIARRLAVAEDRARRLDKARQAQRDRAPAREQRQKQRRRNERKDHKEARASTVDPQART